MLLRKCIISVEQVGTERNLLHRISISHQSLPEHGLDVGVEDLPPLLEVVHGVLLPVPRLGDPRRVELDVPRLGRADEVDYPHVVTVAARAKSADNAKMRL